MASLATVATLASLGSTAASAVGTIAGGSASAAASGLEASAIGQRADAVLATGQAGLESAKFDAAQLRDKGLEETAQGQQDMIQARRLKNLTLSTLQARSAASGFTATDPTTLKLADDIEKYGTLQERLALYGGLSRARGLRNQANARMYEGKTGLQAAKAESKALKTSAAATRSAGSAAKTGSYLSAAGTILGGISTMASKYGKKK